MAALNQPHFQNPAKAREYLEAMRWPSGPICPHCGSVSKDHYALQGKAHRPGLWKCKDCREQFSVTVGTVFEKSKIKLNVWLQAVYLLCSSKKGMSSHQLHRTLGVTYKTAWFMSHRIREAFTTPFAGPVGGGGRIVEVDETFFGNVKPINQRGPKRRGGGYAHKNKIFSLVERDGKARSFHVANVDQRTLKPILDAQMSNDSRLMTDAASHYRHMDNRNFLSHDMVNHTAGEYVRKMKKRVVHTNTVESYFGVLKRGLIGTYHHVSEAHLQRYVTEFDFRFSHRTALGFTDDQRADIALAQIGGKRLMYKTTRPQA
jgi:transposase-like protein